MRRFASDEKAHELRVCFSSLVIDILSALTSNGGIFESCIQHLYIIIRLNPIRYANSDILFN